MENDSAREIQAYVNLDEIIVKREVIDEGYNSAVSGNKQCFDIGENQSKSSDLCNANDDEDNTKCLKKIFKSFTEPKLETEVVVKEVDYGIEREHENEVKVPGNEAEIKTEEDSENVAVFENSNVITIEKVECVKLELPIEVKKENEDEILKDTENNNQLTEQKSVKVETETVVSNESIKTVKVDTVDNVQTNIKTEVEDVIEDDSDSNVPGIVLMEECLEKEDNSMLEKKGYVCKVCKKVIGIFIRFYFNTPVLFIFFF